MRKSALKLRLLAKSTTFAVSYEVANAKPEAGLTQQELAKLLGTDPSVIDRLEEADYEGNVLAMMRCIAAALNKRVEIRFAPLESVAH